MKVPQLFNNKLLYYTFLAFLLIMVPVISAQPPVSQIQQFEEGFVIEGAPTEYIKQNADYDFNFFLYNISNGRNVGGATVSCLFYLADNQGSLVFSGNPTFADGYYSIMIDGANFSEVGHYPYGVNCNSSSLGGAMVNYFEVTPTGTSSSTGQSIINSTFLISLIALTILFFVMGFKFSDYRGLGAAGLFMYGIGFIFILYVMFMGYIFVDELAMLNQSNLHLLMFQVTGTFISLLLLGFMIYMLVVAIKGWNFKKKTLSQDDGWDNGLFDEKIKK